MCRIREASWIERVRARVGGGVGEKICLLGRLVSRCGFSSACLHASAMVTE